MSVLRDKIPLNMYLVIAGCGLTMTFPHHLLGSLRVDGVFSYNKTKLTHTNQSKAEGGEK
jgi:hypothetical protein